MTATALLQSLPAFYVYACLVGLWMGWAALDNDDGVWELLQVAAGSLLLLGICALCGLRNERVIHPWLAGTAAAPISYYLLRFLSYVRESRVRNRLLHNLYHSIPLEHRFGRNPIRWWSCLDYDWHAKAEKALKGMVRDYQTNEAIAMFSRIAREHATTLSRKRTQNAFLDEYGLLREGNWRAHANYFISEVAIPQLKLAEKIIDLPYSQWYELLNEIVPFKAGAPVEQASIPYPSVGNGRGYELYVAGILRNGGWDTQVTPQSGDHGADIIATKDGRRVAVQCKFFSSKVGNSSVQEIYSAKDFYECHSAVVVSNAEYSRAARKIASSLSVALLHHDMLIQALSGDRPQEKEVLQISSSSGDRI
jgi:restriction system protein